MQTKKYKLYSDEEIARVKHWMTDEERLVNQRAIKNGLGNRLPEKKSDKCVNMEKRGLNSFRPPNFIFKTFI